MPNQINPIESSVLGKQISHPLKYAPEILVGVPRKINRTQYNITENSLPFIGWDVWHCYEAGFLTDNGLPVTGLLKILYPSNTPHLIESKSLKLYLNSFNMEHLGRDSRTAINTYKRVIQKDLSACTGGEVLVRFFHKEHPCTTNIDKYLILEELPEASNTSFNHFDESPELLSLNLQPGGESWLSSNLLRSNCKITHQPDWGTVFIRIKSNKLPAPMALLQYLVSFRNENHFHEEVCEMIYKRLIDVLNPEKLMVTCVYTRRGGIDICPTRSNDSSWFPYGLINPCCLTTKLLRQ